MPREVLSPALGEAHSPRLVRLAEPAPRARAPARLTWGDAGMVRAVEALGKVAPTDCSLLLTGETGVGKEVAARWVHEHSRRADGPFVAINCACLSDTMLESELFGHERGAFTGADRRKIGRIERARGGTFFLDEVGELKPELQARLLRVLQEGTFERVGGVEPIVANVRWVAASNRDLREMVRAGSFRPDLYHRLSVFPVSLPALRDRPADLQPLSEALAARVGEELSLGPLRLSEDVHERLRGHSWPGNVRELHNVLLRAAILSGGTHISAAHVVLEEDAPPEGELGASGALPTLEEAERDLIDRALRRYDGHRRKTAEHLGIGLRTLYEKLKRYELG